jgi:hypothetical protein
VRLDCEPHRGDALLLVANASLLLGVLSLCGGVTAPMGFALGVLAWVLAVRDLRAIQAGRGDPAGEPALREALRKAIGAVIFALAFGSLGAMALLSHLR